MKWTNVLAYEVNRTLATGSSPSRAMTLGFVLIWVWFYWRSLVSFKTVCSVFSIFCGCMLQSETVTGVSGGKRSEFMWKLLHLISDLANITLWCSQPDCLDYWKNTKKKNKNVEPYNHFPAVGALTVFLPCLFKWKSVQNVQEKEKRKKKKTSNQGTSAGLNHS